MRLDREGQVTARRQLWVDPPPRQLRTSNVISERDPPWLGVLISRVEPDDASYVPSGVLLRLDPTSLVPTGTVSVEVGTPEHLVRLHDSRAAFVEDREDEIYIIDWATMNLQSRSGIRTLSAIQPRRTAHLYEHVPSDRVFVSHAGEDDSGLIPIRLSDLWVEPTRVSVGHLGHPIAVGAWPLDPDRLLVGDFIEGGDWAAHLSVYDVSDVRYLYGSVPVGRGHMRFLSQDTQGRVWAALPWSGEVLRITPKLTPR